LADETITEIMVNGADNIFMVNDGCMQRADSTFHGYDQLYQTTDRLVPLLNLRDDAISLCVGGSLPSGERVNVIILSLSQPRPVLTSRRFPKPYPIVELIRMGSLDPATGILLAAMVRARFNIVVSGGTGTGKTTFLNAMSAFVPATERIV